MEFRITDDLTSWLRKLRSLVICPKSYNKQQVYLFYVQIIIETD